MTQPELFSDSELKANYQKFIEWKESESGSHVMRDLYEIASGFVSDWLNTGVPVSMDYVFHIERHRIKLRKAHIQKEGIKVEKSENRTLNNTFTAFIARHIMDRRPEWEGLFEIRKSPAAKKKSVFIKEATVLRR